MKKTKFLSFFAAFALAFAACSNVDNPDGPDGPDPGDGEGNKTVAEMLELEAPKVGTETVTVEAYIVGSYIFVEGGSAKWIIGTEETSETNILIADDAETTDTYKVMAIKLGDYRDALSLANNPNNYKKKVVLTGTFQKYCGVAGLVDLTKVVLDGKEITIGAQNSEVDLTGDQTTPVTSINEDFGSVTNNKDIAIKDWKLFAVKGDRNWQGKVFNEGKDNEEKYAQASAHNGKAEDYEYWLVTPPIDVDGLAAKTLEFKTAQAYWQETSSLKVFVLKNENGATTRTEITTAKLVSKTDAEHTFIESGVIDLSAYSGTIYIGWQYIAKGGASNSTTFRVDDVVVK